MVHDDCNMEACAAIGMGDGIGMGIDIIIESAIQFRVTLECCIMHTVLGT